MKKVRLGAGSAYWGDMLEPAVEVAKHGNVDYMGFDHLAELTMSILQRMKDKNPKAGYIADIIPWMKELLPVAKANGTKLITNAGGANPEAAADAVIELCQNLGISGLKIGVVTGDDIGDRLQELRDQGWKFQNLDTGEEDIDSISDRIVAAHAYIGAERIIDALAEGCDIVITGRCSDNALFVAPLMYEFGWKFEDPYWDKVGAAITIGHVLECAECATGGLSNMWDKAPNMARIGFPIAEVDEEGNALVTKVDGSGGLVNEWTIKEQLTYEIKDPTRYMMPDGVADFTRLQLEDLGNDQVRLSNMGGLPRPETLKVQIGYRDGFIGEGQILLPWPDAYAKAKRAEEIVRERFKIVGLEADELRFDYMGVNTLHGELSPEPSCDLNEVGLRIVAKTKTIQEADKVRREGTHLWTLGGIGAAFGVPFKPRPVIGLWPTLVPREAVETKLTVREV